MQRSRRISQITVYFFLLIGAAFCLLPLFWLIRSSLMTSLQIFEMPPKWIPAPFQFQNYVEALTSIDFFRFFRNTLTITVSCLAGALISSSLGAYSYARLSWPGRNIFFSLLLASMMLPSAVTLIPTFIGWRLVDLINTYFPLIMPVWFGSAFDIFLLRQFYSSIPKDLDEAAYVDGAGPWTIFYRIIIPLSKPALIVIGLFSFMNSWNDFMGPLVYLNEESKFTMALGLQMFQSLHSAQWHLLMAASTFVIMPVIIVFFIGQRYFIEGITLTGMKG
ncbi:sugar ABC transporter ATP-binding protein [Paenibacillus sp. BIHB 4019]|uniref:Sugar ABC transporter ATP-binding protein n=1 Tax=Paenibacillus sp. BIHB 4019 TaxID=1870819 RepID=A0A1B2DMR8_9BACL|nr:carbohydrate ABC transporter permease [Paenibacillus sp. BIHB 4019]ANY68997.1 sugar ABC transporter ATP-binding protein [Paenibacillus sp. BIHB 4019]